MLCLCLDATGEVSVPLAHRSFDEIKTWQDISSTVVVVSALHASVHDVELPWVSERKARAALPFMLEDGLAQPISQLHIAFERIHGVRGHYWVVAIDAAWFADMMQRLTDKGVVFDKLTLDWFALRPNEACWMPSSLLVHHAELKGALSDTLARSFLLKPPHDLSLHVFDGALDSTTSCHVIQEQGSALVWIAQRLLQTPSLSLCQGSFRHVSRQAWRLPWRTVCAAMFSCWLLSFFVVKGWQLHEIHQQSKHLYPQMMAMYHGLFPEDRTQPPSRLRVMQWLHAHGRDQDVAFWTLMQRLTMAFRSGTISLQTLHYQAQSLTMTLRCQDFATLEAFQTRLLQSGLQVQPGEAATHGQSVVATLVLRMKP